MLKDMENAVLRKTNPFPKYVSDVTQGWIKYREKGNYAELKEQSSYMTKRH